MTNRKNLSQVLKILKWAGIWVSSILLEEGGRQWLREQKGRGRAGGHLGTYRALGLRPENRDVQSPLKAWLGKGH